MDREKVEAFLDVLHWMEEADRFSTDVKLAAEDLLWRLNQQSRWAPLTWLTVAVPDSPGDLTG